MEGMKLRVGENTSCFDPIIIEDRRFVCGFRGADVASKKGFPINLI